MKHDLRSLYAGGTASLMSAVKTVRAEAGKTLMITGPASFELVEGKASVLGAPLGSSRNIVARGKQTPVEVSFSSSFRVSLGDEAEIEQVDGSTIPRSWYEAGSALVELGQGVVVVIGGADTGKTTLCTFLINFLTGKETPVAVVDADIGQTDLGPPTTMGAGEVTAYAVSLSQIRPSERLFIGLTSPGYAKGKVIRSVKRLVRHHSKPGKVVIVNTDGWVDGNEAVLYKLEMLDELEPNITLGIGSSGISRVLQASKRAALIVGSPDTIKERTRVDRRELRAMGYQKYLAGASIKTYRMNEVTLSHCLRPDALDLSRLPRTLLHNVKDAIVGFLDSDDFLQEIGILKEILPHSRIARIWSRISATPHKIEIGDVKLNNDGREIGHLGQ